MNVTLAADLLLLRRKLPTRRRPDRVGSQPEVERRIAAWQADRNERQTGIDWQFSTGNARIKLKKLYPKIELR
jgi:hypothetical protein